MSNRHKIDFVILALVLIAGFFAVRNAVALGDWWHAQRYDPPAAIVKLAEDAGMSAKGRQLFYRFEPVLADAADMDNLCGAKLGCVEGQSLYILNDNGSPAEHNRSVVTAAHEMLHIAYSRLSQTEKDSLENLLKDELENPAAGVILTKLQDYTGDDQINEAHSYIGSEMEIISSALEAHYAKYFDDRSKSTSAYRLSAKQ